MTNGDVIKGAFPNAEIKHGFYGIEGIPLICLCQNTNIKMSEAFFAEEWWNAPYKSETDVPDKILSEATSLKISYTDHDKDTYRRGVNDVLKIVDKYYRGE